MTTRRLFLDILTLARASGHADGIVRTLREIACYAAAHRPDVVLVLHDQDKNELRIVKPQWIKHVLDGSAKIDTSHFSGELARYRRFRDRLPSSLRRLSMWVDRPRRQAFLAMERIRLDGGFAAPIATRLQAFLMNEKYKRELPEVRGQRRMLLPYDIAVAEAVQPNQNDVLILAGSDWLAMGQQLDAAARRGRPRTAVLCYDITPILFPQFSREKDAKIFKACFDKVFEVSDLVIVTANRILEDVRLYCKKNAMELRHSGVVRLGADFEPVPDHISPDSASVGRAGSDLPSGLGVAAFAIFVSTIGPRKGHRLLASVWKRLLAAGVPQKYDFKLVFVGRTDPLMDDFMAELKSDASLGDSLVLLSEIDDALLARLYSRAGFCLYPSMYEGFGLPVIEGFCHGKAIIASNGGALPETIGLLSPCLDPTDEDAWYDTLKSWIENPDARMAYEQAIKSSFKPRSWEQAAKDFFATVDRELA